MLYYDVIIHHVMQVVMAPHEYTEDFVASYTKLMHGDTGIGNFQKVLDMKVHKSDPFWAREYSQITSHR